MAYDMLHHGEHVVVGLSGGADSCALLHILCSLREEFSLSLTAVHINHMIRGDEAERDAAFAERFCRALDVPFRLYRRNVPDLAAQRKQGLEECGRHVRYEILAQEAAEYGGKIATAHTLSDSVETVLLHLIRGCSIGGLKGIPAVRGNIIRPLIWCERKDIEAYCAQHEIAYITDSSNFSPDYARNKIRLALLPLMREMNPSVVNALRRLSECAADDDACLIQLAHQAVEEDGHSGKAEELASVQPAVLRRALVELCRKHCGITPEYRHILAMQICLAAGKGTVNLCGGHAFCVSGGEWYFRKNSEAAAVMPVLGDWICDFHQGEIITPFGQKIFVRLIDKTKYEDIQKNRKNVFQNSLDYDTIEEIAFFRFRRSGDIFRQVGRGVTKSLKKLLSEYRIPVCERSMLPLLQCGNELIWIDGIGVAQGFQVTEATQTIVYIEADELSTDGCAADRREEVL